MGWRFRRRVRILPGLYLNFSKRGVSKSIGVPGLTMNVSDDGVKVTASAPGTGLSWVQWIKRFAKK